MSENDIMGENDFGMNSREIKCYFEKRKMVLGKVSKGSDGKGYERSNIAGAGNIYFFYLHTVCRQIFVIYIF